MRRIEERCVTLRFVTPAFIGGGEKDSELRTPPFKSLLRRWWRVVQVRGQAPDRDALREREGVLFGHAWLQHRGTAWASRSCVRLALSEWQAGGMKQWRQDPPVKHPEVNEREVGSHLYLGYGPLTFRKTQGTVINTAVRTSVVGDGTRCVLAIRGDGGAWADLNIDEILRLWAWFGTLGSRSRNGWGSFEIVDVDGAPYDPGDVTTLNRYGRALAECFDSDWSHAIGRDDKGLLIWRGQDDFKTWSEAMKALARIKIAIRTQQPLSWSDAPKIACGPRHVLAYPVTHHNVVPWDGAGDDAFRLANQLVFKVLSIASSAGRGYRALAAHFPHRLPDPMVQKLGKDGRDKVRQEERGVWKSVHESLDGLMTRWK